MVSLKSLGVEECALCIFPGMFSNAQSRARVNDQYSEVFGVGVNVHQGPVCSPLLFMLMHCSLLWWRRFWMRSVLLCHGSLFTLMALCSLQTPRRSVSPSLSHGSLAWKLKGSMQKWRKPSSWSMVLAKMSSRNLASTPVLSAVVMLAAIPFCAHNVGCGSTTNCSCFTKRLVEDPNYVCRKCKARPIHGRTVMDVDVNDIMLDVEATFCYLGDILLPVLTTFQTYHTLDDSYSRKQGRPREAWSECKISVAWLALTHKTEMHGEPLFDIHAAANSIEWSTNSTLIQK